MCCSAASKSKRRQANPGKVVSKWCVLQGTRVFQESLIYYGFHNSGAGAEGRLHNGGWKDCKHSHTIHPHRLTTKYNCTPSRAWNILNSNIHLHLRIFWTTWGVHSRPNAGLIQQHPITRQSTDSNSPHRYDNSFYKINRRTELGNSKN